MLISITCPHCDGSGLITTDSGCIGSDCEDVGNCTGCDMRYSVEICDDCYGFGWVWVNEEEGDE